MKTILVAVIAAVAVSWGAAALSAAPVVAHPFWVARQQGLYLSGLLSLALLSLAMLLGTRPLWLESPLGGMDRVYRLHKRAAILAIVFAVLHWLIEMGDGVLKATIGRAGRPPKENFDGFAAVLNDLAEDMGEWAIYAILAMLALTLWKRFPYRRWRFLHRAMPVLYLMICFHALLLAPTAYWRQPPGWLLALFVAGGVYGAVRSLAGSIGSARRVSGEIVAIEQPAADIVVVVCRLGSCWRGHRPGQFAFVAFDDGEGSHPFTIASADRGDRNVTFRIKALGDYTARLGERLRVGQAVHVEGPYGRFDVARCDRSARQLWIAGGIGITPFLAWLESLQGDPAAAPVADLHYCTRDRRADAFVARLEALCAGLPSVRLHVHGTQQGEALVAAAFGERQHAEVWFCGSRRLATTVRAMLGDGVRFHQEAFEMR